MSSEPAAQFDIHDAKTNLSRIIERAEHGEEIIISRAGNPVDGHTADPSRLSHRSRLPGRQARDRGGLGFAGCQREHRGGPQAQRRPDSGHTAPPGVVPAKSGGNHRF